MCSPFYKIMQSLSRSVVALFGDIYRVALGGGGNLYVDKSVVGFFVILAFGRLVQNGIVVAPYNMRDKEPIGIVKLIRGGVAALSAAVFGKISA